MILYRRNELYKEYQRREKEKMNSSITPIKTQ
jgi:hypothetical protein